MKNNFIKGLLLLLLSSSPLIVLSQVKKYTPNCPIANIKGHSISEIWYPYQIREYQSVATVFSPFGIYWPSLQGTPGGSAFAKYDGTQCLHTDIDGNHINAFWCGSYSYTGLWEEEFIRRPVDVAKINTFLNGIWAVEQIRVIKNGQEKDIIEIRDYYQGSAGMTARLYGSPDDNVNFYPTSILTMQHGSYDDVYICGYVTYANTQYPNEPTIKDNKVSFIMKIDLSVANPQVLFWDSNNGTIPYENDFDMALKMRLSSDNKILLTGSCNIGPNTPSGILSMKIDPSNLNIIYSSSIIPNEMCISSVDQSAPNEGYYGVDIWEDNNSEQTKGYFVLANHFVEGKSDNWAVAHLNSAMYSSPILNFIEPVEKTEWVSTRFKGIQETDVIAGQQYLLHNTSNNIPSPFLQPNMTNVNPFLSNVSIVYSASTGMSASTYWHKIQPSKQGTSVPGMDYVNGRNIVPGSLIEDVGRLYKSYILQCDDNPNNGYKLLFSEAYFPTSSTYGLLSKFIALDMFGDETECQQTYTDENHSFHMTNTCTTNPIVPIMNTTERINHQYFEQWRIPEYNTLDCNPD